MKSLTDQFSRTRRNIDLHDRPANRHIAFKVIASAEPIQWKAMASKANEAGERLFER
jgi:hypothetical protein